MSHMPSTGSPKLLSTQAAPARTAGWAYSVSDAGLNLCAKWEELQDIKDNCNK